MLPTFIIIGAPRSGTTSLYNYLSQHPDVGLSVLKETNFFVYDPADPQEEEIEGWLPVRSREEYEAQFAHAEGKAAVGEASPIYLGTPGAARRMYETVPQVKLVAILRNPVDRAYSGYLKWIQETNVTYDPRTMASPDAEWQQPDSHWMRMGFYHKLLSEYLAYFPRDRLRIYLYEDLRARPRDLLEDLHGFIGVAPRPVTDLRTHNIGGVPRNRFLNAIVRSPGLRRLILPWAPGWMRDAARRAKAANLERPRTLPDETRRRLSRVFADDIRALQDLLDRDLGEWLKV